MDGNVEPQNPGTSAAQNSSSVDRCWEHAWSVDEIRKSADDWSLAADVGLLEHMRAFATNLTAQAHDVSREVSQLLHDTRLTDARIQSVTDYFLTLSDNQFIENRVYDEDATVAENKEEKPAAKTKTREEREAEMLPKLKEAIAFGLNVIEEDYDVLDVAVVDSDSDDEDLALSPNEVILEPKDPYVTRPLPHLIGTHGFHQEDDVGVGDLLSGDEVESDGSLSESEDEIEKPPTVSDVSTSDYDSDDESDGSLSDATPVKRKKAATLSSSDDYTSSEDDNLFADKKVHISDSDDSSIDVKTTSKQRSASKRSLKQRSASKRSQPRDEGMFGQEDAEDDLFAGSSGLFGKTGGLFDAPKGGLFEGVEGFSEEEDEESDTESGVVQEPVKKKKAEKKLPSGGISLFGGAIKKGFFQGDDESDEKQNAPSPPPDTGAKQSNFFDDDTDDEDDLFNEKPPPMKTVPSAASHDTSKKSGGLFNESDEDDLFNETPPARTTPTKERTTSETKRPVGGVSMFGTGGGALQEALRHRRATSSSSSASLQKSTNHNSSSSSVNQSNPSKTKFDDVSDDNLFGDVTMTSGSKKKKSVKSQKIERDLFDASSGEDELFSGSSASPNKSTPHGGSLKSVESGTSKKSQKRKENIPKTNPLFDDVDEPLFTKVAPGHSKNTSKTKKPNPGPSLFDLSDSDTDLFASSNRKDDSDDGSFTRKPPPMATKPPSKAVGLFGASDEEAHPAKKPVATKKPPTTKKTPAAKKPPLKKPPPTKKPSLFDEEDSDDDLFSGMSRAKEVSKPKDKKNSADGTFNEKSMSKKPAKPTSKSKDLFASDSDEDLFASKNSLPKSESVEEICNESDGEEIKSPSEAPKKKLAGAVSMFGTGGGELLAAISKRRSESQKSNVSINNDETDPPRSNDVPGDSDEDLFGGSTTAASALRDKSSSISNVTAKPFASATPVSKVTPPVSKVTPPVSKVTPPVSKVTPPMSKVTPPVSKVTPPMSKVTSPVGKPNTAVEKLQANLSINPAALLPGAAPTITSTTDIDAPLESVTKTRSKGQAGRRPPSRRARRAAAAEKGDDPLAATLNASAPSPGPTTSTSTPAASRPTQAPSIESSTKAAPANNSDLFSPPQDDFLADLLSSPSTATRSPAAKKKVKKTTIPDLFDDSDLFETSKPAKKKIMKGGSPDDMFADTPPKAAALGDDLFGDDLGLEPDTSLFSESNKKSKKPKLFEDDLFADLDIVSSKKNASKPVENGDDIFATKVSKSTKKKGKSEAPSILDTDDLFGDSPGITSSKAKTAGNLFDDDDIFGEGSTTKSKEKKTDSLFDDDDIFSSGPVKKSSKTTKKQKSAKSTQSKKSSTPPNKEKEDPDIFEDPLSALLGS